MIKTVHHQIEFDFDHQIEFDVVADAAFPNCEPARILASLLHDAGMLPSFKLRYGKCSGDCHQITEALIRDIHDTGPSVPWYWYIGECPGIGEHSWIECEGWAIDASNGIKTHAIIIQRADDYRQEIGAINIAHRLWSRSR